MVLLALLFSLILSFHYYRDLHKFDITIFIIILLIILLWLLSEQHYLHSYYLTIIIFILNVIITIFMVVFIELLSLLNTFTTTLLFLYKYVNMYYLLI